MATREDVEQTLLDAMNGTAKKIANSPQSAAVEEAGKGMLAIAQAWDIVRSRPGPPSPQLG
ncbi:unannotated protein [freshwater metagenome]|uniref:Unannotated protein n=1 Tax=freshwater metagenome TaxID=449393 RepID=A0A6J7GU97_9ZZZZ|nr:hypothetical protein [Actinomycetota bacterium]